MTDLSTLVFTHKIFIKITDKEVSEYRVTEEEASIALAAWGDNKPVPVPNKKDKEGRSIMYVNPFSVAQIKRYKRL